MDALKGIPEVEAPLLTERGPATLQKTDIFRKIMWFGFKEDNNWYPINTDRVNQILEMNRAGKKPATLELDTIAEKEVGTPLNSDLDSLDKKFKDKSKGKKKGGGHNQQRGGGRRDQRDNRNPNNPGPNNSNSNNPGKPQGGGGNKPNPNNRNQKRPNNPNQPRRPNNNPNNPNNPQKG